MKSPTSRKKNPFISFSVEKNERKRKSFLGRVRSLPEPVRRLILWALMALIVGAVLALMAARLRRTGEEMKRVEEKEMFGKPENLEEARSKTEDVREQWRSLEEAERGLEKAERRE